MLSFFEDPALVVGIPLVVVGGIGLIIAALVLLAPQAQRQQAGGAVVVHRGHPGPIEYVQVGIALAIITGVEVAVYYLDLPERLFVGILIALSAAKFSLVVLFFMHLKFDSRLFSTAFTAGFVLALAIFIVVLTTLGANLA